MTDWGMGVRVVAVADVGHEVEYMTAVAQVHACRIARMAAGVLTGSCRCNVAAVFHRRPTDLHCLCSNFRPLDRLERRIECLGRDSRRDVAREQEDRTWRRLDYKCLRVFLRACDHSSEQQMKAWRGDQAECLCKSASFMCTSS